MFARDFRKSCGNLRVLGGQVIDGVAGQLLPARNPTFAKIAIAVKNHERLCRWIGDADGAAHGGTVAPNSKKTKIEDGQPTVICFTRQETSGRFTHGGEYSDGLHRSHHLLHHCCGFVADLLHFKSLLNNDVADVAAFWTSYHQFSSDTAHRRAANH